MDGIELKQEMRVEEEGRDGSVGERGREQSRDISQSPAVAAANVNVFSLVVSRANGGISAS